MSLDLDGLSAPIDLEKLKEATQAVEAANKKFLEDHPDYETEDCSGDYLYHFVVRPGGLGPSISCVIPYTNQKIDIGDYSNA